MNNWLNDLIDQYYQFLRGRTSVVTETGTEWSVIHTPFIGLFNDTLEVYAKKENGRIMLSDDGATIKNLELTGASVLRSPKRKDFLDRILLTHGITMSETEFTVEATEKDFAQKKHNLISAISEINDMYMLAKHTVASVFREDVQGYLEEQAVIYTPQFISRGKTGLEFTFDFQIAYRQKEIVIKSFNALNKLNLPNFLFAWEDIREAREKVTGKNVIALAVVNDEDRVIQNDYIEALISRNADFILWSKRHSPENLEKIKAA